jgi:hypothetical protein
VRLRLPIHLTLKILDELCVGIDDGNGLFKVSRSLPLLSTSALTPPLAK